ncbi:MAG TPA: hypothetical protein V6C76_08270 [Drouetiella sp.]
MNITDTETYVADVHELPSDMKRVLKVQFREFIHFVEDAQDKIYYTKKFESRDKNSREAA